MTNNVALILTNVIDESQLGFFDDNQNKTTRDLLLMLLQYWLNELAEVDSFVLKSTVRLIDVLCASP